MSTIAARGIACNDNPEPNFPCANPSALKTQLLETDRWTLVRNIQTYPGVTGLVQTCHVLLLLDDTIRYTGQVATGKAKGFTTSLSDSGLTQYVKDGKAWISGPVRSCKVDPSDFAVKVSFFCDNSDYTFLTTKNEECVECVRHRPFTDVSGSMYAHDLYNSKGVVRGPISGVVDIMIPVARYDPRFSDLELLQACVEWPTGAEETCWPDAFQQLAERYEFPGGIYGSCLVTTPEDTSSNRRLISDLIKVYL